MFRITSVDVEIKFVLRQVRSTEGGIDFKLVALKQGDNTQSECVHTVGIHMTGLEDVDFGLVHDQEMT